MTTSGTTLFAPSIADLVVESFSRLQIRGPQLLTEHIIEARRSANLILSDWSANREVNLFSVDLLQIPLKASVPIYNLPADTIQLLDLYLRRFARDATTTFTIGTALTPMLAGGVPVVNSFGDPAITGPGSGVFSSTVGSQTVTMAWPAHGLSAGDPIFLHAADDDDPNTGIISIGGIAIMGHLVVNSVIDSDTLTFVAPVAARETQSLAGATPLIQTTSGSDTVNVILPGHGFVTGYDFTIWSDTTVGGITLLAGDYSVAAVTNSYQFTIVADSFPTSDDAVFIDDGQINVQKQVSTTGYTDTILTPLSRSEYASIPDKQDEGRPTSFWFNRVSPPAITLWLVPDDSTYYAIASYRMRQIQDANPVSGQTLDMPGRFLPAFTAELTVALAEKFRPEMVRDKTALAQTAWARAATEDREDVPLYITPSLSHLYQ